jgi:hypothetical protein
VCQFLGAHGFRLREALPPINSLSFFLRTLRESNEGLVERSRLLELALVGDICGGKMEWSGHYLVGPWNSDRLVNLDKYPRLHAYFEKNAIALSAWAQRPSVNVVTLTQDDRGTIDGIVTYEDRKPVKDATVYAVPMGRPMGAIVPHANTDETGSSQFTSFPSWIVAEQWSHTAIEMYLETS